MKICRTCGWLLVALLAGCETRRGPSLGEVYAGPLDLPLRAEIALKSKVVTTVHHGDKLQIVQQRRRIYLVRTPDNIEGWTDDRNLMSPEQMDALKQLEQRAGRYPSQGVATTFETLNVHSEPQRTAPSFAQIRPNERFDIVSHQISPRAETQRRALMKAKPRPDNKERRKGGRAEKKKAVLPPAPVPPAPPPDWQSLSRARQAEPDKAKSEEAEAGPPAPADDWTLVRTKGGAAGWVLTSRIFLAIPDEVAQYAEGHRIVTYFSLGKIRDEELGADKDIWLWTTVHSGQFPYDFDGFRVFTWNPRRHRYETAYIQRNVEGFIPVLIRKTGGEMQFSVCLGNEDGSKSSRNFAMVDRQVKFRGIGACNQTPAADTAPQIPVEAAKTPSLKERLRDRVGKAKEKLLGK